MPSSGRGRGSEGKGATRGVQFPRGSWGDGVTCDGGQRGGHGSSRAMDEGQEGRARAGAGGAWILCEYNRIANMKFNAKSRIFTEEGHQGERLHFPAFSAVTTCWPMGPTAPVPTPLPDSCSLGCPSSQEEGAAWRGRTQPRREQPCLGFMSLPARPNPPAGCRRCGTCWLLPGQQGPGVREGLPHGHGVRRGWAPTGAGLSFLKKIHFC